MTDLMDRYRARVDTELRRHLADESFPAAIRDAMQYGVFNGGKRIRPTLVYLAGEALAVDPARLDSVAAAIELVHAYSLVHDDLPAMDDDDLRRGKPTCHIAFDEATAILAGDALQTLAFGVIAGDTRLGADTRVTLVADLARAAGAGGMVAGQVLDLAAENASIPLADLEHLHHRKTGDLIALSATAPAVVAGAGDDVACALARFGRALGLTFQVRDDILDVTGDEARIGKPVGSDAANRKSTFVSLCGLPEATRRLEDLLQAALSALEPLGDAARDLRELAIYVARRDH